MLRLSPCHLRCSSAGLTVEVRRLACIIETADTCALPVSLRLQCCCEERCVASVLARQLLSALTIVFLHIEKGRFTCPRLFSPPVLQLLVSKPDYSSVFGYEAQASVFLKSHWTILMVSLRRSGSHCSEGRPPLSLVRPLCHQLSLGSVASPSW